MPLNTLTRLDWGLGNPNKTAALIALLMIVLWALPLVRRWLFWVALPAFTALGICLMQTMSRGGFLAVMAGMGVLLWHVRRAVWPWPRWRVLAAGTAVMVIFVGAVVLQTTHRFAQGPEDRSITNRLEIWKRAPRMMVDAPYGWGLGQSGNAFMSWYQPLEKSERYRTLVNSHLTWLTEFGWPLHGAYVLSWAMVLALCFGLGKARMPMPLPESAADTENEDNKTKANGSSEPTNYSRFTSRFQIGLGVAAGIWVAFGVASGFSSVAEEPLLWILPLLSLGGVLIARVWQKIWPTSRAWGVAIVATLAVLAGLFAIGVSGVGMGDIGANGSGGSALKLTFLQNGSWVVEPQSQLGREHATGRGAKHPMMPKVWLLVASDNTERTIAATYPRDFRVWCQGQTQLPSVGFAASVKELPPLADCRLAVFGALSKAEWVALGERVKACKEVLLASPNIFPNELNWPPEAWAKTTVVFGEFSTRSTLTAWRNAAASFRLLDGTGDFFQDWPEWVFAEWRAEEKDAPEAPATVPSQPTTVPK
jgi:hypothetical protein